MFNLQFLNSSAINTKFEEYENESIITISSLPKGMSHTIFHSLRRFVHMFLPGFGVYAVKINAATNEFSSIPGIAENTIDILRNLSRIVFLPKEGCNLSSFESSISVKERGVYRAKDLSIPSSINLLDDKNVIFEKVEDKKAIEITLYVNYGSGFVTREENFEKFVSFLPEGSIFLDTTYILIDDLRYEVSEKIVDSFTASEQLTIFVKKRSGISAKDMFVFACSSLSKLFSIITKERSNLENIPLDDRKFERDVEINEPIILDDIEISNRSYNCLKASNIMDLRLLGTFARKDLENIRNLGKVSLNEIVTLMKKYNIRFKDE